METERRRYPRTEVRWPVTLRTAARSIRGETLNIAPDGALIRCREPLGSNEVFEVAISVPAVDRSLTLAAQLIQSNVYGSDHGITLCEMGVQFKEISDNSRLLILSAVQRESGFVFAL